MYCIWYWHGDFFRGQLKPWELLHIQQFIFLMVSAENFLPFILLSVSIYYIASNLVLLCIFLYSAFIVFLLLYLFDTPNSLEADFTALCLTRTKECKVKMFFAYIRSINNYNQNYFWKHFISVLISTFMELLFWHDLEKSY